MGIIIVVGSPAAVPSPSCVIFLAGHRPTAIRAVHSGNSPAVAGIALLAAFGPHGIFGGLMSDAGIELVFETAGVVVALIFVSAPFYLRQAIAAFAAVDGRATWRLRDARRGSLSGLRDGRRAERSRGVGVGGGAGLGRALGEFGATLLFAGSLQGVTRTAPLAIFSYFGEPGGFVSALALSAVLILFGNAVALGEFGGDRPLEGSNAGDQPGSRSTLRAQARMFSATSILTSN